jgi:WD40 repeat protein
MKTSLTNYGITATGSNALLLPQSYERDYKRATAMFTTDGKLMATISDNFFLSAVATENGIEPIRPVDKTIEVWDVRKATLLHTFDAHENGVRCIAISSNGNFLATGGHLDAAKLWDIEEGKMIKKLESPEQGAFDLFFSPNSKQLVGGFRAAEQIKIWNVE